jgi:hypothetical protein
VSYLSNGSAPYNPHLEALAGSATATRGQGPPVQ